MILYFILLEIFFFFNIGIAFYKNTMKTIYCIMYIITFSLFSEWIPTEFLDVQQ